MPGSSARNPLRRPGFRRLWSSRVISFTGDGATRTALVLVTAHDGAGAVSWVLLASTLPRLLGPFAGALADAMDRRRLMYLSELGQAVAIGVLAMAMPPLWLLLVLVVVATTLATTFSPASASAVPALVPTDELPRANALIGTAFNFQMALGPVLAGLVIGLGSARVAFGLDAATFVVSAVLLARLPRLDSGQPARRLWSNTVDGVRYVIREPVPRALVLGLVTFVAFAGLDNVAIVFLVQDDLHGSATAFGLVQGCFGAGMVLTSVLLSVWRRATSSAGLLVSGMTAGAGGAFATAAAPNLLTAGAAQAVGGVGNALENIALNTQVQRAVPSAMLGRVFGAVGTGAQLGSGISYVVGGPLVSAAGARVAFVIAAAGALLALGVFLPALRAKPAAFGQMHADAG